MNYRKYKKTVSTFLAKNKKYNLKDEFDVDSFPFENQSYIKLIRMFILFSQTNLKKSCGIVGRQAIVYIIDDNDVNGFAGRIENSPIMGVYKGSLISLFKTIVKDPNDFKETDYLTYQIVVLFLFYHEKAHLIQRNSGVLWELDELVSASGYDQDRHIREFDADLYAVTMILPHIQELSRDKKFPIHELIALAIAGIYILCMDFMKGNKPFYLKEGSHPHGQLRVLYILTQFIMNIEEGKIINLKEHNLGRLWQDKLYELMDRDSNEFNLVLSVFRNHQRDMETYIMELQSLQSGYMDSASLKDPKLSQRSAQRTKFMSIIVDMINETFCTRY